MSHRCLRQRFLTAVWRAASSSFFWDGFPLRNLLLDLIPEESPSLPFKVRGIQRIYGPRGRMWRWALLLCRVLEADAECSASIHRCAGGQGPLSHLLQRGPWFSRENICNTPTFFLPGSPGMSFFSVFVATNLDGRHEFTIWTILHRVSA